MWDIDLTPLLVVDLVLGAIILVAFVVAWRVRRDDAEDT